VHATLNISTAWGGGADLMRLVGYGRGLELLATGRVLRAEEALSLGIFNHVAPKGPPFVEFVDRFVDSMKSRQPAVMRALKAQAVSERFGRPVGDRREGDQQRFIATWISPEHWQAANGALSGDD
jgi:enoyl-CoA hydratase